MSITRDSMGGSGENRFDPHTIFVYWSPENTTPFRDGVPRDPCDSLYHELYHAFEDTTPAGVDAHECVTAAGPSGISIKEVNATRAENARRAALGHRQRTVYGVTPLPVGACRPATPTTPLCHPTRGCPARPVGASAGDPHLSTFDGRRYDFQGAGEFVLAADPTARGRDAFEVQTRQTPWPGSRLVAVDTAMAANVAGDRVEVDLVAGAMAVLVNGVAGPIANRALPGGGTITHSDYHGEVLTVDWPDGSYLQVIAYDGSSLTVLLCAAPGRAGRLTGALGNDDGDPGNDVRTGTGPVTPDYDGLYPGYADSLRVTSTSSLFTYAAGTTTATYTDRTFPDRTPNPIPHQTWASSQCQRFGVADPVSLSDCTVDLAATGRADLLTATRDVESHSGPPGCRQPRHHRGHHHPRCDRGRAVRRHRRATPLRRCRLDQPARWLRRADPARPRRCDGGQWLPQRRPRRHRHGHSPDAWPVHPGGRPTRRRDRHDRAAPRRGGRRPAPHSSRMGRRSPPRSTRRAAPAGSPSPGTRTRPCTWS